MSVVLKEIIREYEKRVPLQLSLEGDHNGLKVGNPEKIIHKIMGCLELTPHVVQYAIEQQIDCIFVHHDPLYFPLHYLRYDNPHTYTLLQLVKHDIALYVSHTNLDIVESGLNDYIFKLLGGVNGKILETREQVGRYGALTKPLTLPEYLKTYVEPIQKQYRVITNTPQQQVNKIALVNGSGADYFKLACIKKNDVFITGDVDYHTAMLAKEYNMTIIDIGHDIEYLVSDLFQQILTEIKEEKGFPIAIVCGKSLNFQPWS